MGEESGKGPKASEESPAATPKPPAPSWSQGSLSVGGGSEFPATFQAYLTELVGELVRVSVLYQVDQALTLMGRLIYVGRDYLLLQDPSAAGIPLGLRGRLAIPLTNVGGVGRLTRLQSLLPWLAAGEGPADSP